MNKKEIAEIKKNFSDDCGFFTMNHVVSAFVDSEKNIKCKTNRLYNTLPAEESELIMIILKKVLSGQIGKNLLEYHFPKDAYQEDGSQKFLYDVLQSRFTDDEIVDSFLNTVVEKMEYVSTYAIFAAHCTYSVLKKNKNDDFEDDTELDYNFIITAVCPVNLRIDGLVYNEESNEIEKKANSDRIVELPSDGFLFPVFSDRSPDVNGVMYYTKNAKKPNTSIVDDLLGCEFVMSCQSEKATFQSILNNVVADELDYSMITTVNEKIQEIVDQNSHETEIPTIDKSKLSSILWESGVSQEKLEHLPKVYETAMGDKSLTAVNLIDRKTVLSVPSITVNITKDGVNKVRTEVIDGKKCLIIDLDDPEISVNGISATIE
ncbi:MAG: DUF4317 domain-containing protein [Ruminococcus sp.]|nr:DUF4317 domain-containing protein [Ruminococcus sp.]